MQLSAAASKLECSGVVAQSTAATRTTDCLDCAGRNMFCHTADFILVSCCAQPTRGGLVDRIYHAMRQFSVVRASTVQTPATQLKKESTGGLRTWMTTDCLQ